ncbi:head completion/stabilization protein [Pseudomonas subflava]|uniref:head completion/stabilization protein n=1 Tax=Pseudomonas subflava TaxID=2952933 RepID=UPI002079976F|nr:head completion/stabilization protein [Pseudomonas subflava]
MSAFVAGGEIPADAYPISNAQFWPDIDGQDLRAAMRINASVTDARLEVAVVGAMLFTNAELADYRDARRAEGHSALADVPVEQIQNESQLLHQYRRAVYCRALAELVERYTSFDATNSGDQKVTEEETSADQLRRDARWAVRDILGISHTTVELL